jgi:hypothetical protein
VATLAVQTPSTSGITPTYSAVAASDEFPNDGRTYVHVKNGGGSSDNVTFNSQQPCNQGADHDIVVAVPNGQERIIGPFPADRFNDPTTGRVVMTHSFQTSVTVAVIRQA